jgi:hypothetical protein
MNFVKAWQAKKEMIPNELTQNTFPSKGAQLFRIREMRGIFLTLKHVVGFH